MFMCVCRRSNNTSGYGDKLLYRVTAYEGPNMGCSEIASPVKTILIAKEYDDFLTFSPG